MKSSSLRIALLLLHLLLLIFDVQETKAQQPAPQPFTARFERQDLDVHLCWPTKPGCLYVVESGTTLDDFAPTEIIRYGNGGDQRVHVYTFPPAVIQPPDPNAPPPDLRPMDLVFFTIAPFENGKTLISWHEHTSLNQNSEIFKVLYPIDLAHLDLGDNTTARFPTFFFYYDANLGGTHKLHYDFSCWNLPYQSSYETFTESALPPNAAATFTKLKSHFPNIVEQVIPCLQQAAVAQQQPQSDPFVPGQRKFYRVIERVLDTDGDGLSDNDEITDYNTDPYAEDSDGDGYSDGAEVDAGSDPGNIGSNPINAGGNPQLPENEDKDGDGLSNKEEERLGTNPHKADTDGDGAWDGAEAHPTEKLLTFAKGMTGRYMELEVGEGEIVDVNNKGQVLYKKVADPNTEQESISYFLWEPGQTDGPTELLAKEGEDATEVVYSYTCIGDKGEILGIAKKRAAHDITKKYVEGFMRSAEGSITFLEGPAYLPPPNLPPEPSITSSESNNFTYGVYHIDLGGIDKHGSVYGSDGRGGVSGNVTPGFEFPELIIHNSLRIWGSGAGQYPAIEKYLFNPAGDEPGVTVTSGELRTLTPEGRSISWREKQTWKTEVKDSEVYAATETSPAGKYYFVRLMDSPPNEKLGYYYHRNTSSEISDGSIPNDSLVLNLLPGQDQNQTSIGTMNDMPKETASSTSHAGFGSGPILGGRHKERAVFWVYKAGKWEHGIVKVRDGDGPPKDEQGGKVKYIEDDGDMWLENSDAANPLWLWQDGAMVSFKDVLKSNGLEETETYEPKKITSKGMIGCQKLGNIKLLLPMGFENPRGAIHELQVTSAKPRVELEKISTTDVTISGGQASVVVKGKVFDPVTGLLPSGAPVPTQLRVYLNSSLQSTSVNLQREPKPGNVWKPDGDEFSFQPFTITFPAAGVNLIRLETSGNAAGFTGTAEFQVSFRPEFTAQPASPAHTILQDILVPSSFDPLTKDTIHLAEVDETGQIELTEIEANNRIFESEQGHLVIIAEDFTPTASVDELPCSLIIPGSPLSWGHRGLSGVCIETGGATLRFRYSETIPARARDSAKTSVLESVHMVPIQAPHDGWFPILFRLGVHFEEAEFELMDQTFPVKTVDGTDYATTGEGAPLVGIVINREEIPVNPEADPPAPVLEFMYYDHTAGQVKSIPLDDAETTHEWKLNVDGRELSKDKLPLKQIKFVNADGSPSLGILPVPVETLEALLAGKQPLIDNEQYAFVELLGHIDGEVVRFGNFEAPLDFFDLIAGSAETLLQEDDCHVRLEKLGDRHFRTREKVLIYSATDESGSPQEITKEQWLALRDLGYLAIHNLDKKVFWGKEDIEWLEKERGSVHPNPGEKMGIGGATDPTKPNFYQYDGFEDHHLFNKYHAKIVNGEYVANPKAPAWSKLFEGEGFDVDEFTVPVRKKVHSKIQHLANKGWESFITEVFDEATGELKPHVTGRLLAQKRGEAFALMHTLADQMGLKLHWCRPWPQILRPNSKSHLFQILVNSRSHLGASLNRLGAFSSKFLAVLGSEWQEEGMRLFRLHVKALAKTGTKACLTCIPLLFSIQSHVAAQQMLVYTLAYESPKVGMAHWLNTSLPLDDLPQAQEIVDILWDDLKDAINGETLVAQLPSGAVIQKGDPDFDCIADGGKIVHVIPYVVTRIWKFPDGRVKTESTMTVPPYEKITETHTEWIIQDWYPAEGDSVQDWINARRRAGGFIKYEYQN